jgi:NADPH:quinone reductase-like Zn-dependent oxidoreductase
MKAFVHYDYGSPDVMRLADVPKPAPATDQVLLRVRAAATNPLDYHMMKGGPGFMRLVLRLVQPKLKRPGVDVAGVVESVGSQVTRFKPGDFVFGCCHGAFAEYACTPESKLAPIPGNLTFEQAASVPIAACTALQGLRDKAHIQPGHRVLINGAGGGVGTFAVQIAKSFGATVTGVCSTRSVELVRSIGADRVLDYTLGDFTWSEQGYDIFFDNYASHTLAECRRVLNPQGTYLGVGGPVSSVSGILLRTLESGRSLSGSQKFTTFLAHINAADLTTLGSLMENGKLRPVIDRCYTLEQTPDALRYLLQGHARGKVVVEVSS